MHQIANLHDRALYAPLHDAMDTRIEPWHMPHFNLQHDSAPAPAEAATDVGADDEKKEPQSEGERMLMLVIFALSAAAALSMVLIGVQRLGLL